MLRFARWSSFILAASLCGCPGPEGTDGGLVDDAPVGDAPIDDAPPNDAPSDAPPSDADEGPRDASSRATLTVTLEGVGGGSVTSAPLGIDCGSSCSAEFAIGDTVVLTATPDASSTFTVWSGRCSGISPTCTFVVTEDTTVTASFERRTETLTVTSAGNGMGNVTSTPGSILCGASGSACSAAFELDSTVTLTAVAEPGATFTGWSGACTGTADCVITIAGPTDVTATFTLDRFTFDIVRDGNGTGSVTSSPAGISCGSTCSAAFDFGRTVTLSATADPGSTFTGWSGGGADCGGPGTCTVFVDSAETITATFTLEQHALSVSRIGGGAGVISSSPSGISCGSTCTAPFDHGSTVTLTATPAVGSIFTGWTGDCSGTGTCTVSMNADASVSAMFTLQSFTLSVGRTGGGTGTVTSGGGEIACGASCAALIDYGSTVTLTATPAIGSTFTGWSGACVGTGPCTLSVTSDTSVDATFSPVPVTLTVTRAGAGSGTVSSSPVGISCGGTCSAAFDYGTSVVLTATPAGGSSFSGWSGGGCSGTGTCTVSLTAATSVTATFAALPIPLTVVRNGTGTGTVTSSTGGISCGATCSTSLPSGTMVTLTATPSVSSTFTGWSGGGCSGVGMCTITPSAATTVTATFTLRRVNLTVVPVGGVARGVVSSSPAAISCGTTCSASFDYGTVVTLSSAGGTLAGWSGAGCSGAGGCTITMNADAMVTATYRLRVGIEAAPASCLRAAGQVIPRATALLSARGHTPVVVSATDIDSLAELSTYDVIVTTGYGDTGCNPSDLATVDPFLDPYVRAGGGLIASGWTLYQAGVIGAPNLAPLLPTNASTAYLTGPLTLTPLTGSPITAGLGTFSANEWIPTGGGTRAGALTILGAGEIGAAWSVGSGRTVFLGPMYLESWAIYDNESLLDGAQPNATELFLRSIEWAGRRL